MSSFKEICDGVPIVFKPYVPDEFATFLDKAKRYFAARNAVNEFKVLQSHGAVPSSLNAIKTPVLQVSSEFKNSGSTKELDKLEGMTRESKAEMLSVFISAKEEEASYYWDKYLAQGKMEELCDNMSKRAEADMRVSLESGPDEPLPPNLAEEFEEWKESGPFALVRVLGIARTESLRKEKILREKRTKKLATDVEMSGTAGPANDSSIEQVVKSVLMKQEQSRRDKKKQKSNIFFANLSTLELSYAKTDNRQRKQEEELPKRRHFKRKIVEETSQVLIAKKRKFDVLRLETFPELFFSSRLESRVLFLQTQSPPRILETLRMQNFGVHKAPGVTLPRNIEYFLAVNLKYIFPTKNDFTLPHAGMQGVTDDIRRWYYFSGKTSDHSLPLYLAQAVEKSEDWPEAHPAVEAGIRMGVNTLTASVSHVMPHKRYRPEPEPILSELGVTVRSLKEYLLLNQYMAFITDKNLGIAVVHRRWYVDEVTSHLALDVYSQVLEVPWSQLYKTYFSLLEGSGLDDKIRAFLSNPSDMGEIPNFHCIPKIHKNPWKIRPIVPMHSYFTTKLAMVVHYYLHPLMKDYPTICQSSRSFVRDLWNCTKGKKGTWRMFTGDVRSMYTNIKTQHLLEALRGVLALSSFSQPFTSFILKAVEFLNGSVFFRFKDEVFQQNFGIAMGLACGPTLANLFMAIWEKQTNVEGLFLFYKRYIDDVFALTLGEDPTDQVYAPGLILDWESKDNIPFLDCEVHLHDQEICVRPYTKNLAHYQYIPWNSGHPLHVKRGLVKTELIRMASLSFRESYYDDRKKRLFDILRCRGYPEAALKAWMGKVKWRTPGSLGGTLKTGPSLNPPLFFPSKYNEVWEQVSLAPVWDEMLRTMLHWHAEELPPWSSLMGSLQRSTNLWDVVRRSNRVVMSQTDDMKDLPDL